MATVLCDITALRYWRLCEGDPSKHVRPRSDIEAPRNVAGLVRRALPDVDLGLPIYALVSSASERVRRADCVTRTVSRPLPTAAFCPIEGSLSVFSPEMTFVDMARRLDAVDLVRYGFELCGAYAYSGTDPRGFIRREPLTSPDRIEQLLSSLPAINGLGLARETLKHVLGGSASPMETVVAMLLCLPVRMGGYGVPHPIMNRAVALPRASGLGAPGTRFCDLFWEDALLALEYDSRMYHAEAERLEADSKRRAELGEAGVSVVSVTPGQVYDENAFARIARIVLRATGKEAKRRVMQSTPQRAALRKRLLYRR